MLPDLEEVYALKIRIKYSKLGNLRFTGHLDVMRYFQKEIRRAELDISYTKGFSPHQIISFAAPLAMGITSEGEYFDAEFNSVTSSCDMKNRLNSVSVDEMKVTECVLLPDDARNSMSVVAASDYVISFGDRSVYLIEDSENNRPDTHTSLKLIENIPGFLAMDEINILKKTKKNEKLENIKPGILDMNVKDNNIYMMLKTGSECNLKPELVMRALYDYAGLPEEYKSFHIHRLETYMYGTDGYLVPLYKAGKTF